MNDQRLIQLLLLNTPKLVVLVGEPVFRLADALGHAMALQTSAVPQAAGLPQVAKAKSVSAYADACRAAERNPADCAMCMHLSDQQPEPDVSLGVACRLSPRLVVVEYEYGNHTDKAENRDGPNAAPNPGTLKDARFYAHGFKKLDYTDEIKRANSERDQADVIHPERLQPRWYAYSLSDYKQAPEWLNARFWAHPERFDIHE